MGMETDDPNTTLGCWHILKLGSEGQTAVVGSVGIITSLKVATAAAVGAAAVQLVGPGINPTAEGCQIEA